jgi:hypothetical protein
MSPSGKNFAIEMMHTEQQPGGGNLQLRAEMQNPYVYRACNFIPEFHNPNHYTDTTVNRRQN